VIPLCDGPSSSGQATTADAVFSWPVRVYWEDTDAGGIVFYANYLKFLERSRTEWLRSLGLSQQRLREQTGAMFVVVQTQMDYLRPARLDDELIVTAQLQKRSGASLIIDQHVLLKAEQGPARRVPPASGALVCRGTVRIAWVDAGSLQPLRIPDPIVQRLAPPHTPLP
jgi:acyl-CoA thioester hydrolase